MMFSNKRGVVREGNIFRLFVSSKRHSMGGRWDKGRMTMIRCRWKYGDLRGKTRRGEGGNAKRGEGSKQKGERKEGGDVEDSEREGAQRRD